MPPKARSGTTKSVTKRSSKPSQSGSSSKSKSKPKGGPRPAPTQHKPGTVTPKDKKRKPPHLRYTEQELKVPQLNGIRPAGVQKPPNMKKGKIFVDDKESMNAIMALVMAEKEGNIESKMMRARQMEEVREARRLEAEKKAQSKKQTLEERKQNLKSGSRKRRSAAGEIPDPANASTENSDRKVVKRKRVSFG